jgi:low affinity Fe/Cu permease
MTSESEPPQPGQQAGLFERFADALSMFIGTPLAFSIALGVVLAWALTGPLAGFSTTWQLVINTGTTIVTFLMVFLLGNASNRITENQDRVLSRILDEEDSLAVEERMIQKVLDRIDVKHIRPILAHLDAQDHQVESVAERILAELRAG